MESHRRRRRVAGAGHTEEESEGEDESEGQDQGKTRKNQGCRSGEKDSVTAKTRLSQEPPSDPPDQKRAASEESAAEATSLGMRSKRARKWRSTDGALVIRTPPIASRRSHTSSITSM